MSKQVNYNENLCAGAAIRDDKGRRISKLFEASHPKMTVGYAKNLIMPDDPTEQEFNFRQSGGGVIEDGVAVIDKVKGNSVVWNQQNNNSDARTKTYNGITYTFNSNKTKCTITGTSTARSNIAIKSGFSVVEGHKYFVGGIPSVASASTCRLCINEGSELQGYIRSNFFIASSIYTVPSGTTKLTLEIVGAEVAKYSPSSVVFQPVLIDLTQMFGAGNEPSTVEEFLQRKPKIADEYAYNEGTIVNNKVEKVVTTGRNLCPYLEQGTIYITNGSEQPSTTRVRTPFIPISNKHSYCTMLNKWAIRNGCFYDRNKNFISSGYPSVSTGVLDSSAIPANAAFCRLIYSAQNGTDVVTPSYDVFMFAVGNTTIPTTKYEPYEEHTLDLSWVKEIKDAEGVKLFEDGMKSAGTAFDEVGKNKAVKRLGVKVLDGSDMYDAISGTNYGSSTRFNLQSFKAKNNSMTTNSYGFDNKGIGVANAESIAFHGIQGYLILQIATSKASSVDELRTYLASHPLTIIYELEEPIEVEYDEKNLTYPVVAGGTEEAIASEPSSAFRADIGYGIDAVKTILDLKARVEALEGK